MLFSPHLTFAFGVDVAEVCIMVVCFERVEGLSFETRGIFSVLTIRNIIDSNRQVFPLFVDPILTLLLVSSPETRCTPGCLYPQSWNGMCPTGSFPCVILIKLPVAKSFYRLVPNH